MGHGLTDEWVEALAAAEALKEEGRYEEAEQAYACILRHDPQHAQARLGLGLVYCFTGRFDESLEQMREATECSPQWVDAHLQLGKTYAMLGMVEEACREFERVLSLHPGHPEASKQLSFLVGENE